MSDDIIIQKIKKIYKEMMNESKLYGIKCDEDKTEKYAYLENVLYALLEELILEDLITETKI